MSGEIPRDIQVNKILKCFIFLKKWQCNKVVKCSVVTFYIIYPVTTNCPVIWLFGKNCLDQIHSLHVALGSPNFKVQMPAWKCSLIHLFMPLFYTDTPMLWKSFYSSRVIGLRKYKKATSHAQIKWILKSILIGVFFDFFKIMFEITGDTTLSTHFIKVNASRIIQTLKSIIS